MTSAPDTPSEQRVPGPAPGGVSVAVVVPCYGVERHVAQVVRHMPEWVTHIIAVDDASTDATGSVLASLGTEYANLVVVTHERNEGVGAATIAGIEVALDLGANLIVKMDGDGQMNPADLPRLLVPLLDGTADLAKGNRLRSRRHAARMPRLRLVANIVLTALTKVGSGYWHVKDAQNGYIAMTQRIARAIPFGRLERRHAFENSLLVQANLAGAVVAEVDMVAIYGDEVSSLDPVVAGLVFPMKIAKLFVRRIVDKYVIERLSSIAICLGAGVVLAVIGAGLVAVNGWLSDEAPLAIAAIVASLMLWFYAIGRDMVGAPRPRKRDVYISAYHVPSLCAGTAGDAGISAELMRPATRNNA